MPHRRIEQILRNQRLLKLPPTATVREAARQMAARRVAAVVVTEGDDRLDGIFTERDMVDRVVAAELDPATTTLAEVMTPEPATVTGGHTVREAMAVMDATDVRHCVVVEQGRAVGIVSMRDFVGDEIAELDLQHEMERHFAEDMR
ncbi:MAG: CBS domain-containing protein [Azospirillum sp.]|nr:CBS domain-containing protein [Azospirillum sp.]